MNNKINAKKLFFLIIPFAIFFVIVFTWHLTLPRNGDELWYSKMFYQYNIFSYLVWRYETWTSRLLIEFVLLQLAGLPRIIWIFLDSFVFLLIAVLIPKIAFNMEKIGEKKSFIYNSLSCFLVLIFIFTNIPILSSAGYIAMTLNYIWPLFFGLLHFYLVKKYIFTENDSGSKKKVVIYAVMIFALIFAINNEILLITVSVAYFLIIMYCLYNKVKIPNSIFLMLFIIFLSYLNVYLCPGNHLRYNISIVMWIPEYYNFTLINKIDLGITVLLNRIIHSYSTFNLFFFGVLGIYIYSITKKKIPILISLIPLIIVLILKILYLIGYMPINDFINEGITKYGLLHSDLSHILVISLIFVVMLFSLMYSLIKICKYGEKKLSFIIICLLILGFAPQMIRGFSPAVFENRIDIYYLFCVLCAIYVLSVELIESKYDSYKNWLINQKYGKFISNLFLYGKSEK